MRQQVFRNGLDIDVVIILDQVQLRVLCEDGLTSSDCLMMQRRYVRVSRCGDFIEPCELLPEKLDKNKCILLAITLVPIDLELELEAPSSSTRQARPCLVRSEAIRESLTITIDATNFRLRFTSFISQLSVELLVFWERDQVHSRYVFGEMEGYGLLPDCLFLDCDGVWTWSY